MRASAIALTALLVASACSSGTETTTPVPTVAPTTISTTTTLPPAATPEPTTTTTPPTTTVAALTDDWIADLPGALQLSELVPTVDYDRDDWGSWTDADGDCTNTRHEVLILESLVEVEMDPSGCKVVSGRWFGWFSGTYFTDPSLIDIDHVVPLANAHRSGGWVWSAATKSDYYNYLSDPSHLMAVSRSANRSKGSRGPDEWRPPDSNYWCSYAQIWVNIKVRWGLAVTGSEMAALQSMLLPCDEVTSGTMPPTPAETVTTAAPTTIASDAPANPGNSKNCGDFVNYAQAKAWFDTYYPYYGDVARLDGDDDGEPCESLPGGP